MQLVLADWSAGPKPVGKWQLMLTDGLHIAHSIRKLYTLIIKLIDYGGIMLSSAGQGILALVAFVARSYNQIMFHYHNYTRTFRLDCYLWSMSHLPPPTHHPPPANHRGQDFGSRVGQHLNFWKKMFAEPPLPQHTHPIF